MGRKIFNKLGAIFRAFTKTTNKENQDEIISSDEISTSSNYSSKTQTNCLTKAKSSQSLSSTLALTSNDFNQLKRSHATCDIFQDEEEENPIVACTRSLQSFCDRKRDNICLFPQNFELQHSKIWSQAAYCVNSRAELEDSPSLVQVEDILQTAEDINEPFCYHTDSQTSSGKMVHHKEDFQEIDYVFPSEIQKIQNVPLTTVNYIEEQSLGFRQSHEQVENNDETEDTEDTVLVTSANDESYTTQIIAEEDVRVPQITSDSYSENNTEYEIVNIGQIDVFKEFKTTIAKMKNVLKVEDAFEERKKKSSENKNIWTQTVLTTFNQISTSTEGDYVSSPSRNEEVMVQMASRAVGVNSARLSEKIRKRRRTRKSSRRKITRNALEKALKKPTKLEKQQYNKCIVYHITQHKEAIDRGVGTSSNTEKQESIISKSFSAVHFGPIQEFPLLLNKHENENSKRKDFLSKESKEQQATSRRKSASLLNLEKHDQLDETLKSKTLPFLNIPDSLEAPNKETTANWFVFQPTPPLVLHEKSSSSSKQWELSDNATSSTQELIMNILEDEFKNKGLKGEISNSAINLIKDHVCDKLYRLNPKDIPDVMITVCVPLREIVTKMKKVENLEKEDKAIGYEKDNKEEYAEFGVQVQLQVDSGRKNTKRASVHQQTEATTKAKKSSANKSPFGNKATCYSDQKQESSKVAKTPTKSPKPPPSRIFYSDHSTNTPNFTSEKTTNQVVILHSDKNIAVALASSSEALHRRRRADVCTQHQKNKEGFFLNLPPHRYKKKRDQISKLFEDSNSSDQYFFGEPKLLYHVHESSFYSSSKTDHFSGNKKQQKSLRELIIMDDEKECNTFFPIHQIDSRMDINLRRKKPKFISFSELPKSNKEAKLVMVERSFISATVNTSNHVFHQEKGTQVEFNVEPKLVEAETNMRACVDSCAMVNLQQVRFHDGTLEEKEDNQQREEVSREIGTEDEDEEKLQRDCNKKSSSIFQNFNREDSLPFCKKDSEVNTEPLLPPEHAYVNLNSSSYEFPFKPSTSTSKLEKKKLEGLGSLMKEIVEICNTNFEKSRDCVVDLTLYNLIKDIVIEHSNHLTENEKVKVQKMLKTLIPETNYENSNVKIVESAIEKMVKIPMEEELKDEDQRNEENREKKRSRSRHHSKRHQSKHRSRHRERLELKPRESIVLGRSSYYQKHHCGNRCEMHQKENRRFRPKESSEQEYEELVKRLGQLERYTKQLSTAARNYQMVDLHKNDAVYYPYSSSQKIYTASVNERQRNNSSDAHGDAPSLIKSESSPIPRSFPKIPVTKIVINLSNLKLLTKNCMSLGSSSDSEAIKNAIAYQVAKALKTKARRKSHHSLKMGKRKCFVDKEKKSNNFIVQLEDKEKQNEEKRDVMKIKIKKKFTTQSEQTTTSVSESFTKKIGKASGTDDQKITAGFFKREYQMKNERMASYFDVGLPGNQSSLLEQPFFENNGNFDEGYRKIENRLLEGFFEKESD